MMTMRRKGQQNRIVINLLKFSKSCVKVYEYKISMELYTKHYNFMFL